MNRKKILVGMSGGVDSSVSAALLLEQGHDVEGVFLKVWSDDDATDPLIDCPWEADLRDAQKVADQLGITLHIRNVQREYFERVVERMKEGYAAGETPNPDVLCNSEIKFGILYDWARANHFDYLATGHYAQVGSSAKCKAQSAKPSSEPITTGLHTAADAFKDQTYFLWRVPRERFEHILFPIGHLQKSEVRAEAERFGLSNSSKPDSQGICFLGSVNVHDWLKRELGTQPGPVVTRDGQRVGSHDGAALATIGQRHGFGLPGGGPIYYVVEKRAATNTLVVDTRPAVMGTEFGLINPNWLVNQPLRWFVDRQIEARIRHQGQRIACTVQIAANQESRIKNNGESKAVGPLILNPSFFIRLEEPAFAIAPGQSVVLYNGDLVLGGGIIQA